VLDLRITRITNSHDCADLELITRCAQGVAVSTPFSSQQLELKFRILLNNQRRQRESNESIERSCPPSVIFGHDTIEQLWVNNAATVSLEGLEEF
jgi:hypothetical protein